LKKKHEVHCQLKRYEGTQGNRGSQPGVQKKQGERNSTRKGGRKLILADERERMRQPVRTARGDGIGKGANPRKKSQVIEKGKGKQN